MDDCIQGATLKSMQVPSDTAVGLTVTEKLTNEKRTQESHWTMQYRS